MQKELPIIISGAGPIGLTAAIELTLLGYSVQVVEKKTDISEGSRAICYAKRTLEIWHRIGCAIPMLNKGITWNKGRVHFKNEELYSFNLLPLKNGLFPAFINLQQNFCEMYLLERLNELNPNALQLGHEVTGINNNEDFVEIELDKDAQKQTVKSFLVLACDGATSFVRRALNLSYEGKVFKDRFLICDIKMKIDLPAERLFWFDPDFHSGNSALLHKQADDVWRIDLQLGWTANPEYEKQEYIVRPRIQAILNHDEFDIVWVSIYTFQCRTLEKYDYKRILFVGDSAHQVSPFGARGANGGVQDVDNLVWKIDSYFKGQVNLQWLGKSYSEERKFAAEENIKNSTYTTDFMISTTPLEYAFRTAALVLSKEHIFARDFVNSGRLSVPAILYNSSLNLPASERKSNELGSAIMDVELCDKNNQKFWLLELLNERCFHALIFTKQNIKIGDIDYQGFKCKPLIISKHKTLHNLCDDTNGLTEFYQLEESEIFILRPDNHLMARFKIEYLEAEKIAEIFKSCINHIINVY